MPTFGSLFAGIGGIDLGLERAGWTGRWQVEWDEWCQRVLAKHWPDLPRYGDITTVDWSTVEPVDLLAGGFPCQPVSVAGKQLAQADARWLWPEFARAIRDLRPRLVLVENVPGLLAHGMGDVLGDLATLGYDAEWDGLSAAEVGAPHLRERVWITARDTHRDDEASQRRVRGRSTAKPGGGRTLADAFGTSVRRNRGGVASPPTTREGQAPERQWVRADAGAGRAGTLPLAYPESKCQREQADEAHTFAESRDAWPEPSGRSWWATEPDVGRVAHGVPSRVDRLRGLGNAVVPQVVEVIGRQLLALSPRLSDPEGPVGL